MSIVSVESVSFKYNTALVLDKAALTIDAGDYLGIIGPNGSSKSTLLKLMLGILKPTAGVIKLYGTPIDRFKDWQKIGYVKQNANQVNSEFPATVEEIVRAGLFSVRKKRGLNAKKRVDEVLGIVGALEFKHKLIGNLSGGQQQKVFIARALVARPEILFLDEPTVGIDSHSQLEFYELLSRLNSEFGVTIVMVSHDISVISERVNRFITMENGKAISHPACCAVPPTQYIDTYYQGHMHIVDHKLHSEES